MKLFRLGALLTLLLVASGCLGVIAFGRTPFELNGQTYYLQEEQSDDRRIFTVWSDDGQVERSIGEPGPRFRRIETEGRKVGPTQTATVPYEEVYDDFSLDRGGGH